MNAKPGNSVDGRAETVFTTGMTTTRRPKLSPQFLAMVQERHRRNWNRLVEQDEREALKDAA